MRLSTICLLGAGTAIASTLAASTARATIEATLTNGATTVGPLIGANNPGGSSLSKTLFTVGNFDIVLLNATSNSGATPPPALDQLNATALTVTNTGSLTQTLTINASDVGFAPPATGQPLNLSDSGSVTFTSGSAGDSATLTSYADPNNIFFSTANPTPPSNISWSGNGTVLLPVQTTTFSLGENLNFSMSNAFVLVLNSGDTVNLSYTSNVTPEPASLAIMGLGCGLALLRRRKPSKV